MAAISDEIANIRKNQLHVQHFFLSSLMKGKNPKRGATPSYTKWKNERGAAMSAGDCIANISAFQDAAVPGMPAENCAERRFEHIVGNSPALEAVLAQVERVAPTDSTVLVLGETGTGKELIARAIHNISPRCRRPFVKLNCAAIPFDLLESELFGHEKGAFTGAIAQKIGRFEMADTGTLFLDEIGDIPLALQPKLLRVLQEREFERLGSGRTHRIDVRLVAATHRDLIEMVSRREFRIDLYYRLNVFPVELPALRERGQDIPQLVAHFTENFARRMGKRIDHIPQQTMSAFTAYSWPGNVRELQNLIERAVILSNDGVLPNPLPISDPNAVITTPSQGTFRDSERSLILQTLHSTGWMIGGPAGAAVQLGLKRTTLIAKMKKLGISRPVHHKIVQFGEHRESEPRQPATERDSGDQFNPTYHDRRHGH